MISNNWIYYKLQNLPQEIKQKFNIKSLARLDCVSFYNENNYKGMTYFVNNKGHMHFYKSPARKICNSDLKRQAVWMLTNKSINLSSIFVELVEYPQYGYGNPPHQKVLGKGYKPNPLFAFRNDLYLFIINADYSEIELIIVPEQKNLWNTYYFKLIQGELNEIIQNLRDNSKPFFDYGL